MNKYYSMMYIFSIRRVHNFASIFRSHAVTSDKLRIIFTFILDYSIIMNYYSLIRRFSAAARRRTGAEAILEYSIRREAILHMKRIFIDGSAGTTGLRIRERLAAREDVSLVTLPEPLRKDPDARRNALNACDAAFLCLPDDAAREAVGFLDNPDVIVLDTSTAHRTEPGWTYGFPELSGGCPEAVRKSRRIAVPGCHASGFLSLAAPLTAAGLLPKTALLTCTSLTGYSGGGKKMIAEYEAEMRDLLLDSPRQYGLSQQHKHLREMTAVAQLENSPVFCPIVADYYSGMEVTVPLFASQLSPGVTAKTVREFFRDFYRGPVVSYREDADEGGFLASGRFSGRDCMEVSVLGNDERILLVSRFDNLGKGASGAATQCMNLALGLDPLAGLVL